MQLVHEGLPILHHGPHAPVALVHERWEREDVSVDRIHLELRANAEVNERGLLGADGVRASEVCDQGAAPGLELTAERCPCRWQRPRAEHGHGLLERVDATLQVRTADFPPRW